MKKNVAVVMGGFTEEFDISLESGQNVLAILKKLKYDVYPVIITRDEWYLEREDKIKIPIDKADFSVSLNGVKLCFDVVFNTIHGVPGEDGTLQAYFDMVKQSYTSCGMYASALTYNKRDLIAVMKSYGIKTAENQVLYKGYPIDVDDIVAGVGLPCFVKPNRGGSSFGISKVYEKNDMVCAVKQAFAYDDEIIIESFLEGVEVTVGVVSYKGNITVLPITEIVSENDFFNYDAKYLGESQEITPARISGYAENKLRVISAEIYGKLKMRGFSRSEFILVDDEPYLLEVNTIPGLTEKSLLPQQIEASGIDVFELFDDTVQEALKDR